MSEDVKGKIKKIVADHLGIEEEKVTEEASFIDDLGADSLDTVELVMAFEEEFGSEISEPISYLFFGKRSKPSPAILFNVKIFFILPPLFVF